MNPQPDPRADRKDLILLGLGQEEPLELFELARVFLRQVVPLRKVGGQVVEFPDRLGKIPLVEPGLAFCQGTSAPKVQAYQPSW